LWNAHVVRTAARRPALASPPPHNCALPQPCLSQPCLTVALSSRRCRAGRGLPPRGRNEPPAAAQGEYANIVDCFIKTARRDGPLAFYKGFVPNFGRLGSWNVIMFLTLEQTKKLAASM
jgi:Mitochondrial carrier protein